MNGELELFLEAAKADPQLREEVTSLQTAAEVVAEGARRGFNFSESDLTAASDEIAAKKAESEASSALGVCACPLVGGGNEYTDAPGTRAYNCGCAVVGFGLTEDDAFPTCYCAIGGGGGF